MGNDETPARGVSELGLANQPQFGLVSEPFSFWVKFVFTRCNGVLKNGN